MAGRALDVRRGARGWREQAQGSLRRRPRLGVLAVAGRRTRTGAGGCLRAPAAPARGESGSRGLSPCASPHSRYAEASSAWEVRQVSPPGPRACTSCPKPRHESATLPTGGQWGREEAAVLPLPPRLPGVSHHTSCPARKCPEGRSTFSETSCLGQPHKALSPTQAHPFLFWGLLAARHVQ